MLYKHALALYPYSMDSKAAMGVFPPTGLEYIASNMKGSVGRTTLLDLRHANEYRDVQKLSDFIRREIDLLCISIIWNSQFHLICDLISKLPKEVTTVVGGNKATEEVEFLFEACPNIDIIVRGEGEETIKEVAAGLPLKEILGLSYRQNGNIIHNKLRPPVDITAVEYPDRTLRKQNYYWNQNGVQLTNMTFDTVLTSRGCPYNCKFCSFSLNPLGQKRKYAERPLDSVIDELKSISADVVMFSDDNFFTNPKRSKQLCDLIIENGIRKRFVVQTRIEIANDPELLEKAEAAGFKLFLIGIESPHDRILKQLSKGFTQQQIRDAFKTLNLYLFFIHGYFIYGNIGESEDEMVYIATFAKELKLDTISFQKLRINRFSPLIEVVDNTPGYYYHRLGGPLFSDRYDRRALKQIRNKIRAGFYDFEQIRWIMRKAYASRLLTIREMVQICLRLPVISIRLLKKEVQKKIRLLVS